MLVDILEQMIRDSQSDAQATRDEWQRALDRVFDGEV